MGTRCPPGLSPALAAVAVEATAAENFCVFCVQCRDRIWGHKAHERSPIFFQFLDGVHQLMYAYPSAFEFNEWWLLKLTDGLFGNGYSDFRYNNELERTSSEQPEQLGAVPRVSVWNLLLGPGGQEFKNHLYAAAGELGLEALGGPLDPPMVTRVWVGYFNRWMEDPANGKPSGLLGSVSFGPQPISRLSNARYSAELSSDRRA